MRRNIDLQPFIYASAVSTSLFDRVFGPTRSLDASSQKAQSCRIDVNKSGGRQCDPHKFDFPIISPAIDTLRSRVSFSFLFTKMKGGLSLERMADEMDGVME